MPAALSYTCSCGRRHLVSLAEVDADGDSWSAAVEGAADRLELELVDGSRHAFVCSGCGTVHVRGNAPSLTVRRRDELGHTFVLN